MDTQTVEQLQTLFSMIERNLSHEEIERGGVPAITIGTRPGETFTLRGDAYYLLRNLSERLARPGYAAPGLSLEGARVSVDGRMQQIPV